MIINRIFRQPMCVGGGEELNSRSSRFELLRIVAMLLILGLHYCMYGCSNGIYISDGFMTSIPALILGSWGTAGVGCFFLMNGYFAVGKEKLFKTQKFVSLLFEIELYVVILYLIGCFIINNDVFSIKTLIITLGTPVFMNYWYITVYLLLYMVSPFLQKTVTALDKVSYRKCIIVLTVIIPVYKFLFSGAPVDYFVYSIYMWMIGYYIGKYYSDVKCRKAARALGIIFLVVIIILLGCYAMENLTGYDTTAILSKIRGIISPFQVMVSLWLFLSFKDMEVKDIPLINKFATSTLAVYLIHMNSHVREFLFRNILQAEIAESSPLFIIFMIFSCVLVYLLFSLLDFVRIWMFSKVRIKKSVADKIDIWFMLNR